MARQTEYTLGGLRPVRQMSKLKRDRQKPKQANHFMMTRSYPTRISRPLRKPILLGLAALAVILVAYGLFNHYYLNRQPKARPQTSVSGPASATGPKTANSTSRDQSLATDNQGAVPNSSSNSSYWTTSTSGLVTVKQPGANSVLGSGAALYGSAKVSQVQYRLIDNQVGVLAQGPLNVVGGNFSATLHFRPIASSGRLDVFSFDSQGAEVNEVQIPVRFQ